MINDFLDFTEFISWTIFSEPYIFCTGRTTVYHAVQSKSCTAFVPYKKKVVRPYISLRTSAQPYLDSVNFQPSKMKPFLVSCPNPNDSFISFYILSFCFIEKWPQI